MRNRHLIILCSIYGFAIFLYGILRPSTMDWTPSFHTSQNTPFASEILYRLFDNIRDEEVIIASRPLYNTLGDSGLTDAIYFVVTEAFQPGDLDELKLLEFIAAGNTAFISTESLNTRFLDTLGISRRYAFTMGMDFGEWFYNDNLALSLEEYPGHPWRASTRSGHTYFESDSLAFDTLGRADDDPNFIHCTFGKGDVYLHAFPYAFTNYHMLYADNHTYISEVLGQIPSAETWIWDQFYCLSGMRAGNSPLAVLNSYPSFRWAYWLSVAGVLIFIVFTAKRRQRIIPVKKMKHNTTLDFVRTIGDLYFNRGDARDLMQKKLWLLQGVILRNYRMEVAEFTEDEANRLVVRSHLPKDLIERLFRQARKYTAQDRITSSDLHALQEDLDAFYGRGTEKGRQDNRA